MRIRGVELHRRETGRRAGAEAALSPETARAVLPDSGVRAGAAFQAATLPVRAGERAARRRAQAHLHTGQDLVSEQEVQVQAPAAGQDLGAGRSPAASAQSSRPGARARRKAVSRWKPRAAL